MIRAIKIKNFKALEETDWIPLEGNVVFVGPNNSGKTTALQALALWNYGVQKWVEKKQNSKAKTRTGASINRKDLFAIPVSNSKYVFTNLIFLESERENGKLTGTKYVNIEIAVKGVNQGIDWICGLEFRYGGDEAIYVKPLHGLENNIAQDNIELLLKTNVAFLPPMSGLKLDEEKLLFSTIEFRMGEGRTAEVLGNICLQVIKPDNDILLKNRDPLKDWLLLTEKLKKLFFVDLLMPELDNRGLIKLKYIDATGNELELGASGRGMQQIILLLAYILIKPNCIILLDEPDAHLEILKQEQVYELLSEIAKSKGSQLLIASHSEVVLRKAIDSKDNVISFYPHSKPKYYNNPKEIVKALKTIGFEEYYLAQQKGWIMYLEGGTDLPIIKKFAQKLSHPVLNHIETCFHKTINTNDPTEARIHFAGLKAAKPDLIGIALYDNIQFQIGVLAGLNEIKWQKNEIENYFYSQEVLIKWAIGEISQDLFGPAEAQQREEAMKKALDDILPGAAKRNENDPYWSEVKASSEIEKVLKTYFKYMGHPGDSSKAKYVDLINYLPDEKIDHEIKQKLDFIFENIPQQRL
jgi:ABC-type lipoprotein export system ATPase subunit